MDIYATVKGIDVSQLSYDKNGTYVDMFESNNTLGIHLKDAKMNVTVDYAMELDPPIIEDTGNFTVSAEDLSF